MNRLAAARNLRYHYGKIGDLSIRVYCQTYGDDHEWDKGLYTFEKEPPIKPEDSKKISWKELLKLIRENYPQREEGQCSFRYRNGSLCTSRNEHEHCKCCDSASPWTLCHTCGMNARKVRYQITKMEADFLYRFGIPYKRDDDEYSQLIGDGEDIPCGRGRGDREDFHA